MKIKLVIGSLAAVAALAVFTQSQQPAFDAKLTTIQAWPQDPPANLDQQGLAYYAWELFIAACQGTAATLSDGSQRETPSASFIDAGRQPLFNGGRNPLIFEGLYHRAEAYPYFTGSAPPPPLRQVPVYRFAPIDNKPFTVTGAYVNLDETNQIGQNFLYYRQSKDPNFPVLFMAKVNATEVVYAWDRPLAPSNSTSWVFPNGVLEIKAAWRRVSDFRDFDTRTNQSAIANRMHQAPATYYVGDEGQIPIQATDTFALIALHIIQKSANYQSFIFSTFEHVDAVTRDRNGTITDPAFELTYKDLEYQAGDPAAATAVGAYTVNAPGQSGGTNAPQTYSLPQPGPLPGGYHVVVQPKTITTQVNDTNNAVRNLILQADRSSVWANYRLKGVQAVPTSDQTALDYYLANIVVESSRPGLQFFRGGTGGQDSTTIPNSANTFYNTRQNVFLQGFPASSTGKPASTQPTPMSVAGNISENLVYNRPVPPPKYVMGGCQGCHGVAQQFGGDFSFLAAKAGVGKPVDAVPPSDLTAAQLAAYNEKVAARRAKYLFKQVPKQ